MTTVRDSEVRDALIFLTQLCAVHENGRPKGRAYLDLIRQQFPKEEFKKPGRISYCFKCSSSGKLEVQECQAVSGTRELPDVGNPIPAA